MPSPVNQACAHSAVSYLLPYLCLPFLLSCITALFLSFSPLSLIHIKQIHHKGINHCIITIMITSVLHFFLPCEYTRAYVLLYVMYQGLALPYKATLGVICTLAEGNVQGNKTCWKQRIVVVQTGQFSVCLCSRTLESQPVNTQAVSLFTLTLQLI